MKRILIIALLGLATPVVALVSLAPAAIAAEAQTLTFVIENMTCELCPLTVKTAMGKVAGVQSVEIDFEAKTATVVFDPSLTDPAAIAAASTDAGYPAQPKA